MKLLLTSDSDFLFNEGYGLLGIPVDDLRVGYVITANKHKNPDKDRLEFEKYHLESIDIEGKSGEELRDFFKDKNIIHVKGGNPFYLLKAMKDSGFDKIVKELVNCGVIYVGNSAGAYVACPTIEMASWTNQDRNTVDLTDLTALNLVPFLLKVHFTVEKREIIKEKMKNCRYNVKILKDGQGILVEDGKYIFVGEGEEIRL